MRPGPWETILLTAAAFRVWKLIADDTILDRPRAWVLGKLKGDDRQDYWALFITCPWCAGFWLSGAALAAYCLTFGWIGFFSFAVVWLAISAVVGVVAHFLDF